MIPSDTGFQIGWKQNQAKYGGVIINQRNLTTKYVEFSSRNRNLPMTCLSVEHGFMDLFFISRGGWATITDWCWRVGHIWRWLSLKTSLLGSNYLLVDFLCLRMFKRHKVIGFDMLWLNSQLIIGSSDVVDTRNYVSNCELLHITTSDPIWKQLNWNTTQQNHEQLNPKSPSHIFYPLVTINIPGMPWHRRVSKSVLGTFRWWRITTVPHLCGGVRWACHGGTLMFFGKLHLAKWKMD